MLVSMLALLPASAQTMQRLGAQMMQQSDAQTAQLSATSLTVDRAVRLDRSDLSAPAPSQSHAGRFAAAVFRVLASQNTIDLDGQPSAEMDAVLRPPESDTGVTSLFSTAKKLYDTATSYKTERAMVTVDPLGLKCRLSVNLGKLGSK